MLLRMIMHIIAGYYAWDPLHIKAIYSKNVMRKMLRLKELGPVSI